MRSSLSLRTQALAPRATGAASTVSVVIPCYNYARFLPDAVLSVLSQEGVDVDVIVVDDASVDDSVEVARVLADRSSRVRVLANEENAGPVATFNRGLAEARGEFVVRLDADDLLTPGSLARAVAVMQALPRVGLVYGHPIHFDGVRTPARTAPGSWLIWRGMDWLTVRCAAGANVITSPEAVMRRSVVDRVGGQRDLAHTHDMEMWFRIAAHADVAYITDVDQAWHREHPASLSLKADDPRVILREIWEGFEVLFSEWTAPEGEPGPLRTAAARAVAAKAVEYARRDLDRGSCTTMAEELFALAERIDPTIWLSAEGRAARAAARRAQRWPRRFAAAVGAFPRLVRRVSGKRAWTRWAATGVYEPLRIERGGDLEGN